MFLISFVSIIHHYFGYKDFCFHSWWPAPIPAHLAATWLLLMPPTGLWPILTWIMPYLEVLSQHINLATMLTANPFAAWAAVAGVVTDMDAGRWQGWAVGEGTGWSLGRALTLGAVVTVQEIPLAHVVEATVGLASAANWTCQSWARRQS